MTSRDRSARGRSKSSSTGKAAKRKVPKRFDLADASNAQRARVFRQLAAALRKAGVAGQLSRIEVNSAPTRARGRKPATRKTAKAKSAKVNATIRHGICAPGFVLRLVCEKRQGTVFCEERCVPV